MPSENVPFSSEPGFCSNCGTILSMLLDSGPIKCFLCKTEYGPEAFGAMESHYVIHFHTRNDYTHDDSKKRQAEGPVVDRNCRKCRNDKMSYATLQLRSADEGQTVFYTCTKCGYKECENS